MQELDIITRWREHVINDIISNNKGPSEQLGLSFTDKDIDRQAKEIIGKIIKDFSNPNVLKSESKLNL